MEGSDQAQTGFNNEGTKVLADGHCLRRATILIFSLCCLVALLFKLFGVVHGFICAGRGSVLLCGFLQQQVSCNPNESDMKIVSRNFFAVLAALAALMGAGSAIFAQPTLTVTPSVISNTYPGVITLAITGVTNGEKVTVQRWLDLNGNGSIDAGEPMMDAGKITDNNNGNAIIGGVTNLNVPFDINSTTGAITTTLNCPAALVLDNMVGQYVFRVISSGGQATATFAVTNALLGQSISGIVYGSDGVTPFPHAVVVAQDQQANDPAGGVVADATGHYFLALRPSSYSLVTAFPNYYYDQSLAPSVVLTNGMLATNNLTLTNGTVTISGSVYDAGNSNSIGGMLMQMSSGSFFAIAFTDTNGNYSNSVTPSFWTIQPVKQRLARRGYVEPEARFQADATAGSVTNANIALPRGNALFYGRITDNHGAPFANIELDGGDGNNFDSKGYSDQNGYFAVAILGDRTNYWNCNANDGKNSILNGYIVNSNESVTNAPNQATLENFIALPATATISGHVQNNSGTNIVGVSLNAYASIGGNNYQTLDGSTDNSGNYSLATATGQWSVQFQTGGHDSGNLDVQGYVDISTPHPVTIPPTNAVLNITVYPIGTPFITGPQRFGSQQFGFIINGATNVSYTVQVSTNLASTNWAPLFSLTLTNNIFPVTDVNATNSARFYRVQKN